jgi:hypothetical protein
MDPIRPNYRVPGDSTCSLLRATGHTFCCSYHQFDSGARATRDITGQNGRPDQLFGVSLAKAAAFGGDFAEMTMTMIEKDSVRVGRTRTESPPGIVRNGIPAENTWRDRSGLAGFLWPVEDLNRPTGWAFKKRRFHDVTLRALRNGDTSPLRRASDVDASPRRPYVRREHRIDSWNLGQRAGQRGSIE